MDHALTDQRARDPRASSARATLGRAERRLQRAGRGRRHYRDVRLSAEGTAGLNDQLEATSAVGQADERGEVACKRAPVLLPAAAHLPLLRGPQLRLPPLRTGGLESGRPCLREAAANQRRDPLPRPLRRACRRRFSAAPAPRQAMEASSHANGALAPPTSTSSSRRRATRPDQGAARPAGRRFEFGTAGAPDLWTHGKQTAASIAVRSRRPGPALCTAFQRWYGAFGGDSSVSGSGNRRTVEYEGGPAGHGVLRCTPGGVRLGLGPNAAVASRLAG